jgi:hypothetical protein
MPKKSKDNPQRVLAALLLINRAPRPIILEVETADSHKNRVVQEYSNWSGQEATWDKLAQTGFALGVGQRKWGKEYRIYFFKDYIVKTQLERYGYSVDDGDVRHPGTFRVNDRSLFRELVEVHGFRLGKNI